jgi:hypothetical protein
MKTSSLAQKECEVAIEKSKKRGDLKKIIAKYQQVYLATIGISEREWQLQLRSRYMKC